MLTKEIVWSRGTPAPDTAADAVSATPGSDSGEPLDRDQLTALAIGAHMSLAHGWAHDTLDIPADAAAARRDIDQWWGISSGADARKVIGLLLDGMHSAAYEVAYPLVDQVVRKADGHQPSVHREFLRLRAATRGLYPEYWADAYDTLLTLRTSNTLRASYVDAGFPTHVRSWDLGRIQFVVRTSLKAGHIERDECWPMLLASLSSARGYYANWRQFAHGVVMGRAFWMAGQAMPDAKDAALLAGNWVNALLARPDSPWRLLSLRPGEEETLQGG